MENNYSLSIGADTLFEELKANGYKKCIAVSTIKKQDVAKDFCDKLNKLLDGKKTEDFSATVTFTKNILSDIDSVEKIKSADCVIFVERYGKTRYKFFYEATELIKKYNIPVLGVYTV